MIVGAKLESRPALWLYQCGSAVGHMLLLVWVLSELDMDFAVSQMSQDMQLMFAKKHLTTCLKASA